MARILIVDDDPDVIEIVRYTMMRGGHELNEAKNGKEGLEAATRQKFDLIILDLMMPEMDGLTLNQHLGTAAATKNIPVIILTAKGRMKDTFENVPNVRYYMEKPFEPVVLEEKVKDILAGKTPIK